MYYYLMKKAIFLAIIIFNQACIFTPPQESITLNSIDNSNVNNYSLIKVAKEQIGTPYRYGGMTPYSGFDCSGFVCYVYKNSLNIRLPRRSIDQSKVGEYVSKDELIDGDLLFFDTSKRGYINHVGIYLKNGKFIHASSGKVHSVTISDLNSKFYKRAFRFAKRVVN